MAAAELPNELRIIFTGHTGLGKTDALDRLCYCIYKNDSVWQKIKDCRRRSEYERSLARHYCADPPDMKKLLDLAGEDLIRAKDYWDKSFLNALRLFKKEKPRFAFLSLHLTYYLRSEFFSPYSWWGDDDRTPLILRRLKNDFDPHYVVCLIDDIAYVQQRIGNGFAIRLRELLIWRNLEVLMRDVAEFKVRYLDAYRAHHENMRNQLPVYRRDLELVQLKLRALELLNTMPELGQPTGNGLESSMDELAPVPSSCSVAGPDILMDSSPWCASCRLSLALQLPVEQLARLTAAVDMDLGVKNRQLSTILVERILHGKQDERLDDLLKIVQASDLSALSNTINVELVGFIQGIIS